MRELFTAALLASACVSMPVAAQEADDSASKDSEKEAEIVVSAARTPTPITAIPSTVRVIDREQMETQLAVSPSLLDSLAFSIPSLAPARQKLTSTGESLRGRTPLYMVDSIPQSTPLRDGKRSGFTIDPAFVERVEVIYGANAIQGVGATGGVINYVTVDPPRSGEWFNRMTAEVTTDDFEENGFHYRLAGVAGRRVGAFDFVAGAAFEKHDLFYSGGDRPVAVDNIQGELMDSHSLSLFGKAGVEFAPDQRIEGMVNFYKISAEGDYLTVAGNRAAGITATSRPGTAEGDMPFTEAFNATLSYTHEAFLGGSLTAQAYFFDFYARYGGDRYPFAQDPQIAPIGTLFDQSALSSQKHGAKLTWVKRDAIWDGLQLVLGADYLRDKSFQELAQTGRLWVPEMIYQGWAPFAQVEQPLFDDLVRLSGGVRWEHATLKVRDFTTIATANRTFVEGGSPSFDKALLNAGLVIEPADGFTLFGSYAQGFTMPDVGLILRARNTPGESVEDLVDLQPIIADNMEIGTAWRRAGMELTASYFWSNSDLGSRILVVNGAGQVRRERTEIEGLEISASYQLPTRHRIGASFAALDGRYDSNGDNTVDRDLDGRNIAPDRLNAFLEGAIAGPVSGRVQVSRLFDREFDVPTPFNFDGYTLVDLILRYQTEAAGQFSLAASNLLDQHYVNYFSQTVDFVTDREYVAGRGRAIVLRWQGGF